MAIAMAAAQICFAQAADLQVETREGVRTAIVLPAVRGPAPTVIVLHGAFSSAAWTARHYGFADAAAARGFAVVFPQGIKGQWNDGRSNKPWKPNDVAFLKVLVGELIAERVADPSRIYLTGISAGGMMTLRMLCEASDLFAGAGTVIANMPVSTGAGCRPARPVPIVMFNGLQIRGYPTGAEASVPSLWVEWFGAPSVRLTLWRTPTVAAAGQWYPTLRWMR